MSDQVEDFKQILKEIQEELKEQKVLLNALVKEIKVIKDVLTVSSQITNTLTPNSTILGQNPNLFSSPEHLDNSSQNQFMTRSSPTSQPQVPFVNNNEIMAYIQNLKENMSESTREIIIEDWKQARKTYKLIIQSKNDEESTNLLTLAKTFVKYVLMLMHHLFKPSATIDASKTEDFSNFMRELGPLPITLNYDLIEFVNAAATNPPKKLGRKTSEQLYKHLEELYVSVIDVFEMIIK